MKNETENFNPSIVALKTGDKLITVLREAFEGEGEDQKGICLVMNYPYELTIDDSKDNDLQVKFSRWCPYSVNTEYRIPYDSVLAIGQPDPGLAQAYQQKVEEVVKVNSQETND